MTARLCVGVSLGACAVSSDQATTGMSTHGNPDYSLSHSHPVATLPGTPGRLAQLGERRLDKAEVTGSSPVSPTFRKPRRARGFRVLRGIPRSRRPLPRPSYVLARRTRVS